MKISSASLGKQIKMADNLAELVDQTSKAFGVHTWSWVMANVAAFGMKWARKSFDSLGVVPTVDQLVGASLNYSNLNAEVLEKLGRDNYASADPIPLIVDDVTGNAIDVNRIVIKAYGKSYTVDLSDDSMNELSVTEAIEAAINKGTD